MHRLPVRRPVCGHLVFSPLVGAGADGPGASAEVLGEKRPQLLARGEARLPSMSTLGLAVIWSGISLSTSASADGSASASSSTLPVACLGSNPTSPAHCRQACGESASPTVHAGPTLMASLVSLICWPRGA